MRSEVFGRLSPLRLPAQRRIISKSRNSFQQLGLANDRKAIYVTLFECGTTRQIAEKRRISGILRCRKRSLGALGCSQTSGLQRIGMSVTFAGIRTALLPVQSCCSAAGLGEDRRERETDFSDSSGRLWRNGGAGHAVAAADSASGDDDLFQRRP